MGRFASYELLDLIGAGGMAEVFAARGHRSDGSVRELALKRITPQLANDEDFQAMLLEEARVTSTLHHPNIVRTLDWGRLDDTCFIAMERVVGLDCRDLLTQCAARLVPIPSEIGLFIVGEVLAALDYAHGACDERGDSLGIVHRDISPANVLISTRGEVKLTDFGIARAKLRASHTQVGQVRGKPRYMSPEQARGQALDARSDVFAAGLLLYELLTGVPAFEGGDTIDEVIEGLKNDVPLPSQRVPDLAPGIDPLVRGMCDREPASRYASAADAKKAIDGVVRRRGLRLDAAPLARLVVSLMAPAEEAPMVTRVLRVDDIAGSVHLTSERPAPAAIGPPSAAFVERTKVSRNPGVITASANIADLEDRTQVRRDVPAVEESDRTRVRREPDVAPPVPQSYFATLLEDGREDTAATRKNPVKRAPPASFEDDQTVGRPAANDGGIPAPPWFALAIVFAVLAVSAVVVRFLKGPMP